MRPTSPAASSAARCLTVGEWEKPVRAAICGVVRAAAEWRRSARITPRVSQLSPCLPAIAASLPVRDRDDHVLLRHLQRLSEGAAVADRRDRLRAVLLILFEAALDLVGEYDVLSAALDIVGGVDDLLGDREGGATAAGRADTPTFWGG